MPLLDGYGRATIAENVRLLVTEGKSQRQAVAIALTRARAYFRRYGSGPTPSYLRPKRTK